LKRCLPDAGKALSLTKFGTVMMTELGVGYAETSKRGYYTNIALIGAGLKIVAIV
jgi:hypothetical protein